MKKLVIVIFLIFIFISFRNGDQKTILIPNEAIRFRVIANSNDQSDQNLKLSIKDEVDSYVNNLLIETTNIEDARLIIQASIPEIESIIKNYNVDYKINFGDNYFPEKLYKGVSYLEGNYESLVITLGKGVGENWWCVMFPPLCRLDIQKSNLEDVDYQFFIKNIIDKYM